MAKTTLSIILFLFCSLQCLSFMGVQARRAPALYVFGDSLSDPGNNFFLPGALAKADYKPYGIDFPNGTLGRFTNGFTMAEHLALLLRLPIPPPILDSRSQTTNFTVGFNYASSSAGILPDTGVKLAGANLCLEKQVQLFKKTAQEFLPSRLRNRHAVTSHIRNSIYFILIGSNDYTFNYGSTAFDDIIKSPIQFAELLVNELGRQVLELYKLGARKFIVSEIGPIGCTPGVIKRLHPPTRCEEPSNALVSHFNIKLASKTNQLSKILKAARFVTMKADFLAQVIENPKRYGFKDSSNSCCTTGAEVQCATNVPPCRNRRSYVFFDAVHTTDAANKLLAKACFKGVGTCTPMNIRQLVKQN